jgi:hypothetical protein
MSAMDCSKAEELLSDHLDGTLHEILKAELTAHLADCRSCRELREALEEVVTALRTSPVLEPPEGLVERISQAALSSRRLAVVRPAFQVPSWVQAAAAGFALIALGTMLMVVGPEKPTRMAQRLVGQTVTASSQLIATKDRLVEDVRIFGVLLSTAFEGRLERVNERVEDYRRLLEKRRAEPSEEPKRGSGSESFRFGIAAAFRTRPTGVA